MVFGLLILFITACNTAQSTTPDVADNQNSMTEPIPSIEPVKLPLSEPGPYAVGIRRNFKFVDASRNNREVILTIWYPAVKPDASVSEPISDAAADMSAAPYPVIMSSSKAGFVFANQLVSYGFVYVGINRIETYKLIDQEAFDQPLDYIFALNQISSTSLEGLEGVLNTEMVGTTGYSYDGTNSVILSGARVDPQYHFSYCKKAASLEPPLEDWYFNYYCDLSTKWDELSDYIGKDITASGDGLWQPISDARIKAVMPMAADGAWLLGEKGLAAADRAVLMIQASKDSLYQPTEGEFIFNHLGSSDKTMVTFVGQQHMMIYDPIQIDRMAHFAVAFFSHQLQGKEDMAYYYSEEFIEQYPNLAYGFYQEE
jgi:predicted dienelactone hydrolase